MTKVIDLELIKQQIAAVDEQIKKPLPTPPVGTPIIWFDKAIVKPGAELAAVVTKVEGPGKVTLVVFRPCAFPEFKRSSLHEFHLQNKERHVEALSNCGAWAYPRGTVIPKSHNELHLEALHTKRSSLLEALENASQIKKTQEAAV